MKITAFEDSKSDALLMQIVVEHPEFQMLGQAVMRDATRRAGKALARRFLRDHGEDVMKALLAMVDAGAAAHEALRKAVPDQVLDVVRHETPTV